MLIGQKALFLHRIKKHFMFFLLFMLPFFSTSIYGQDTPKPKTTLTKDQKKDTNKFVTPKEEAELIKKQAQEDMFAPFDNFQRPSLITEAVALSLFALLPFIVMILTSYMKIVIVLSLLRSALGVNQAPPNQIINGIAFMLSIFVMYPTMSQMYELSQNAVEKYSAPDSLISKESSTYIIKIVDEAKEPLREFLKINSSHKHHQLFFSMAYKILPEDQREKLTPEDFLILVPSFITSQLKYSFEIGVLIYLPFFVIDLVTSNILLAMGMMMLSPVTISMPLKLFLLVMLDGWTLLVQGLINTFRTT